LRQKLTTLSDDAAIRWFIISHYVAKPSHCLRDFAAGGSKAMAVVGNTDFDQEQ